jgi:predicted nuclease of predicted toxin-antitoxin system
MLTARGVKAVSVVEIGLSGASDRQILEYAKARGYVVVTHDRDFGSLAIRAGEPFSGIVYLRPGQYPPERVVETLAAIDTSSDGLEEPFLLVARRTGDTVRVRVRKSHW